MKKKVIFFLDNDLYEKFLISTDLSKESKERALEQGIRWYIAKTFENAYKKYSPEESYRQYNFDNVSEINTSSNPYYAKAIGRIPNWALKPEQYNHKIIRAYFTSLHTTGSATISMMEELCSKKDCSELYVPTFKSNYTQMKIDGSNSHGKVFEDDGKNVWIWEEVKNVLLKYKSSFYSGDNRK